MGGWILALLFAAKPLTFKLAGPAPNPPLMVFKGERQTGLLDRTQGAAHLDLQRDGATLGEEIVTGQRRMIFAGSLFVTVERRNVCEADETLSVPCPFRSGRYHGFAPRCLPRQTDQCSHHFGLHLYEVQFCGQTVRFARCNSTTPCT